MPTTEERMKALRDRVAANQEKLAGLKTVQRLNEAIKTDAERLAGLEAAEAKKVASRRRKEDAHIKIVLASGVMLSSVNFQVQTIRAVIGRLSQKDRKALEKWCANRGLDLTAPPPAEPRDPAPDSPPLGEAVVRVITGLDRSSYEWLTSELLSRTSGNDRKVVEELIASRP